MLSTRLAPEPTWLVTSVDEAVRVVVAAGGALVAAPVAVPVGRLAVVSDPFGNRLVLLDPSVGRYVTDDAGRVTGVQPTSG
ncbi:hypothetical protein SAMN04488543_2672 [Friedmanniella luteola]|uniref:VOC domain-containing protein n=1 Tax=Friedmanniella luteola TaxID=546871 RepID=A0A1H1W9N0_9ACTN|nr:hypothetical protein [Friedmanniella luteola]SDS93371.1 hypothetical protein SAMN04488543_2672 [Friedmanniella luteola]